MCCKETWRTWLLIKNFFAVINNKWEENGIKIIKDLLDNTNVFMSRELLIGKYKIKCPQMYYNSLLSAMESNLKNKGK